MISARYIGSYDGNVYALNAANGAKIWNYDTGVYILSSPAVANGIVYIGTWDNEVYALNAANGAKIWSYSTGNSVNRSPAVANGVVYVGSYDGNVYALNAATGSKIWSYKASGEVASTPAVANGVVYIGSWGSLGGNMYALSASTGSKIWSYTTVGNTSFLSPAIANGIVYVGSDEGRVYAFGSQAPNIKEYQVSLAKDAMGVGLNPSEIQKGANVYYYFQVKAWDGSSTYTLVDGIPVTVSSLYSKTFTSQQFGVLSGIIQAGPYDTAGFSGTQLPISVISSTFNGVPVKYVDSPPFSTITPRTSTSGFSFPITYSVGIDPVKIETTLQDGISIENDGTNIISLTDSRMTKLGAGLSVGAGLSFSIGSESVQAEAGADVLFGGLGGADCVFPNPTNDATQTTLNRYLVTLNYLDYVQASFVASNNQIAAFAVSCLQAHIQSKISDLGVTSYYSPIYLGGWSRLSADAGNPLQVGIPTLTTPGGSLLNGFTSKFDTNALVGKMISGGGSVQCSSEASSKISIYPDVISVSSSIDLNGYAGFNFGFASFNGPNNGIDFTIILNYDASTKNLKSIAFELGEELTYDMFTQSHFGGLLNTLQNLVFQPSTTFRISSTFEIPASNLGNLPNILTASHLLTASSVSIIDVYAIMQEVNTIMNNGVSAKYTITSEIDNNEAFSLGGDISLLVGVDLGIDMKGVLSQSFITENGYITYANGELTRWTNVQYSNSPPQTINPVTYLTNSLLGSLQTSNTVVQMQEPGAKLYLNVFDNEGNHDGYNAILNSIDMNIPGSYYYDNQYGRIDIVLPSTVKNFTINVDGVKAEQNNEEYAVGIYNLNSTNASTYQPTNGTISKNQTIDYRATLDNSGTVNMQYSVSFGESNVNTDYSGTIVTIDGKPYTTNALPISLWFESNSIHNFSFASPLIVSNEKQYVWASTTGLSNSVASTLTIQASGNITGNFLAQYSTPSSSPTPTASPTPTSTPTATQAPTTNPTNSPTHQPVSSTNTPSPTNNPIPSPSTTSTPSAPEFPSLLAVLTIIIAVSVGLIFTVRKRKMKKSLNAVLIKGF